MSDTKLKNHHSVTAPPPPADSPVHRKRAYTRSRQGPQSGRIIRPIPTPHPTCTLVGYVPGRILPATLHSAATSPRGLLLRKHILRQPCISKGNLANQQLGIPWRPRKHLHRRAYHRRAHNGDRVARRHHHLHPGYQGKPPHVETKSRALHSAPMKVLVTRRCMTAQKLCKGTPSSTATPYPMRWDAHTPTRPLNPGEHRHPWP